MRIEQIIEFELRGLGPLAVYSYNWLTSCKTKISMENLRVDYYLLLKYCWKQGALLPSTWTKSVTIKILHHNSRF